MKRSIELIKNRSDIGAGTRGSDMGVDAIEIAAINKGSQYFNQYPFVDVQTRNHSVYENDKGSFGKRIKQVLQQCKRLATAVEDSLSENRFPLVFSGDHSSAIGTIAGIRSSYPQKQLGVIWIDAHADIHSPYTTPSGNLHGMPLAAALGIDNLDCKINEVDMETLQHWDKLKAMGHEGQSLVPDHLVYFGVRDTEEPEDLLIAQLGISNITVKETRLSGIKKVVDDALGRLSDCEMIYVSFDVDSMDSEVISNGTGTPVPKGFEPPEILRLLQSIVASGKVVCMEVVEVNPLLDSKGNKMAEVTFDILEQVTNWIEEG